VLGDAFGLGGVLHQFLLEQDGEDGGMDEEGPG